LHDWGHDQLESAVSVSDITLSSSFAARRRLIALAEYSPRLGGCYHRHPIAPFNWREEQDCGSKLRIFDDCAVPNLHVPWLSHADFPIFRQSSNPADISGIGLALIFSHPDVPIIHQSRANPHLHLFPMSPWSERISMDPLLTRAW
jgi:hypothetical protein